MKIMIVSDSIPPDYSGAGQSAMSLAKNLFLNNQLYGILTRTKKKQPIEVIPEKLIYRLPVLQEQLNKVDQNPIKKFIVLLIDFPLLFLGVLFLFLKHFKKIDAFLFVSTKWTSLVLALLCIIFQKKYIIETTLLGSDDPIPNKQKKFWKLRHVLKSIQFNNASAVTCISNALAKQCLAFGIEPKKVFLIPRAIDTEKFYSINNEEKIKLKSQYFQENKAYPLIVFTGVLIRRKGIDIVYNTFKKVVKRWPNAHLLLVGPTGAKGETSMFNKIVKDITKEKLTDKITITGHVTNLEDYLNISDVFLFPSRNEGFGRVFIEAMACGLPVVAKRIPEITDYIFENGKTGIIIDSENPNDYYNAIEDVLLNKKESSRIIENALNDVKLRFTEDVVFKKYLTLFNFAINKRKSDIYKK